MALKSVDEITGMLLSIENYPSTREWDEYKGAWVDVELRIRLSSLGIASQLSEQHGWLPFPNFISSTVNQKSVSSRDFRLCETWSVPYYS